MLARLSLLAPIAVVLVTATARAQDDGSIPLTEDSRLVTRAAADGDSTSGWTTSVRLPAIEGPAADDPGWAGLAGHLDQIVAGEREAFHENLAEWEPSEPGWVSTFDADGSILWAAPPILSIVLDFSVYYAGAAHPGHYAITVVWDAGRGRALTTRDLFPATADWEEVVSREAIPILERDLGEMADASWIQEGAGPQADNFRRWALVEEGLIVFFDPYQVASYAAGPQAVTIPRAALADVADPDGPLAPE
jgi:hypothetical protein